MPINFLPPEILGVVFELGLERYVDFDDTVSSKRNHYLSCICLVSSLWKEIAYGTPQLWSLVLVPYRTTQTSSPHVDYHVQERQLDRARNAPLDIILSRPNTWGVYSTYTHPDVWVFWQLLTKNYEQWRSLRIDHINIDKVEELRTLFPPLLPNLMDARIEITTALPPFPVSSAPRLRHYHQRAEYFPFISAASVVHLTNYVFFNRAVPVLQTGQAIRSLHLPEVSLCPPRPTEGFVLPSVQHISVTKGVIALLHEILTSFLIVPNLQSLSFNGVPEFANLRSGLSPITLPSLKTIRFENFHIVFLHHLSTLFDIFVHSDSVTSFVSILPITITPEEMTRSKFEGFDPYVRDIEKRATEIVWLDSGEESVLDREDRFRSWPDVRRRLGVIS